jgi:uncharacterized protein
MQVRQHTDAASFLAAAGDFLSAREAFHNLPIAIARHCVDDPSRYPGRNLFAVIDGADGVAGFAMMTPPHRLQLYVAPGGAVDLVADALAASDRTIPGVSGPVGAADAFARAWVARRGGRARRARSLRAFELTTVIPAPRVRGAMRPATAEDLPFVEHAYRAFHEETGTGAAGDLAPEVIGRRAVADGRLFVWDDGGPVSQAGIAGTTPRGRRVGAVWTPPDRRRRGYATALVAALSQHVLDSGRAFAFLFTDLANPISNSIYPKVGYRPVADYREIDFAGS